MNSRFKVLLVMLLVLLGKSLAPVSAQAPSIKVSPVWRPAVQLTTIDLGTSGVTDVGDDFRYVVADIYATTNVEFWAVGITCTVNKNVLEAYTNIDALAHDDEPMLAVGADWSSTTSATKITVAADGKFNFAIATTGEYNLPMGINGVTGTLHIAGLRFRVKAGLAAAMTSPLTCVSNFLNRDGKVVLAAVYTAPPPLSVIPGYVLTGKVTYQGINTTLTAAQTIDVVCDDSDVDTTFDDVVTTANLTTGLFSANNLRTQGRYNCEFIGNIRTAGPGFDLHLKGTTDFNLTTAAYQLLPVVLRNGNTDSADDFIAGADLGLVTGNWKNTVALPFANGDASGDKKIDEFDLTVVNSNFGRDEPVQAYHVLYSLPRSQTVFQDSRILLGTYANSTAVQFVPGANRDYWPAVSPDGKKIAFVRNVGTGSTNKFALFTAPIATGVVGTATRITPASATYDAFAPSWSLDGSQIAFICSYSVQWFSTSNPRGNLCLIEASGANFRLPIEANLKRPLSAKINPPSWFNDDIVFFTYAPEPGVVSAFDNRVSYLTLPNYVMSGSASIPTNSDFPAVRTTPMGTTLFYRFDDGAGNRTMRFAVLNATAGVPNAYPTPNLHNDVGGVATIGYFTVSTGADPHIIYYTNNPSLNNAGGTNFTAFFFTGTGAVPNWSTVIIGSYTINSGVGNPGLSSSYYAALLNTAVFLP